jgi:hypothetical protein
MTVADHKYFWKMTVAYNKLDVFFALLYFHWGKYDVRNCNYSHPKMADVESGVVARNWSLAWAWYISNSFSLFPLFLRFSLNIFNLPIK